MTNDDRAAWLALGVGLASREHLARLLAEARPADLDDPEARRLLESLGEGRDAVVKALAGLGVAVLPGVRAADAVLDAAREAARKRRQVEAAHSLADAAKLLSPEKFVEYASRKLDGLRDPPPVAGRVAETA